MKLSETLLGRDTSGRLLPTDQYLDAGRQILGSTKKDIALILCSISSTNPFVSFLLPDAEEDMLLLKRQQQETTSSLLVSDQNGLVEVTPIQMELDMWPTSLQATVYYLQGKSTVTIDALGDLWRVPCRYAEDRLFLSWPKKLGIRGALGIKDEDIIVPIPLLCNFPCSLVAENLKQNSICYQLLEKQEMTGDFFTADSSQEAISVFILAMYKHAQTLT